MYEPVPKPVPRASWEELAVEQQPEHRLDEHETIQIGWRKRFRSWRPIMYQVVLGGAPHRAALPSSSQLNSRPVWWR